jgi:hypothetical protein
MAATVDRGRGDVRSTMGVCGGVTSGAGTLGGSTAGRVGAVEGALAEPEACLSSRSEEVAAVVADGKETSDRVLRLEATGGTGRALGEER